MLRRRLLIQALALIVLGSIQLSTPRQARAAAPSAMCGGSCGVCFQGFECPEEVDQSYACSQICDLLSNSCDDCTDQLLPDECPFGYDYGWWCDN